jgi:endoglycosylceramidase
MKQQLSVVLFLFLCFFITYSDGSANVHVNDTLVIDDAGRVRIYHGVNFVNKGFPWYPSELLDPVNVANLSQWGINFVRLGY